LAPKRLLNQVKEPACMYVHFYIQG
jgi:hypothetical protein